ncbi:MAG: hypothetical protein ABNH26_13965 [Celeribacter sp.]
MPNAVAILGLFLFWASLFWLPLTVYRAVQVPGRPKSWAIAAIFAFLMVFMGYTRTIARAQMTGFSAQEAFAWSIAWLMPIGIALYLRVLPGMPALRLDKYLGIGALVSFPLALPRLPDLLTPMATLIW